MALATNTVFRDLMLCAGLDDPDLEATHSTDCKSGIKQLGDEFEIILGALVYDGTADDTLREWVDVNFDALIKAAEHAYSERYGECSVFGVLVSFG